MQMTTPADLPGLGKKYGLKTKDENRKLFIFQNSKDVKTLFYSIRDLVNCWNSAVDVRGSFKSSCLQLFQIIRGKHNGS
jgi:hypothetical protein